jgi:cell division protein ZipA
MPELPRLEEKIIGLLVTGDRDIPGPRLHQMLQQEGLQYDDKTRVYHRFDDAGGRVFSVANVLKPGDLNPEQAVRFSTPGLSMFLVLPVAVDPFVAFEDFIETATRLAQNLHVGVYDLRRQVLDNAHTQALYQEIVQWSQGSQADDPNAQPAD